MVPGGCYLSLKLVSLYGSPQKNLRKGDAAIIFQNIQLLLCSPPFHYSFESSCTVLVDRSKLRSQHHQWPTTNQSSHKELLANQLWNIHFTQRQVGCYGKIGVTDLCLSLWLDPYSLHPILSHIQKAWQVYITWLYITMHNLSTLEFWQLKNGNTKLQMLC